VDTKRHPALTSPWKIGFLVSLMLIFLSIGVNYFIFRTFNLSWSSIGFNQGSWFFHREQFVKELLPLVAFIAFACLVAYFAISSAVRRYKAFLDSGHDYRRLIKAIKSSDDLDGENFARRLGKYPELRKFLTNVRDQVRSKEKELKTREDKLNKCGNDGEFKETFEKECRTLAEAVPDLVLGEVHEDLHITSEGLARIEENLRSLSVSGQEHMDSDDREQIRGVVDELKQAGSDLASRLSESSIELEASCSTAKELEKQLSDLAASIMEADDSLPQMAKDDGIQIMKQSLKTLQTLCEELSEVGEESKSIAINTALRAGSGEGAVEDMIQLAEDVRKVALKFIDLSRSFGDTCEQMHNIAGKLESERDQLDRLSGANSELAPSVGALKNKISLWVERIIILNDHLKNAEDIVDLSLVPIEEKLSGFTGDILQDSSEVQLEEGGSQNELAAETHSEKTSDNEFELETVDSSAFGGGNSLTADMPDSSADSQEILGIEKNPEHIFSQHDEAGEKQFDQTEEQVHVDVCSDLDHEAEFDELPADRENQPDVAVSEDSADAERIVQAEEDEVAVAPKNQSHQALISEENNYDAEKIEGQVAFDLTENENGIDHEFTDSANKINEKPASVDEDITGIELPSLNQGSADDAGNDEMIEDDEAIDLYSLGAVDIG
jgi:predicted nuclease with TOPRIM domain